MDRAEKRKKIKRISIWVGLTFKNAIEHLGNKEPAIILGGIYALHQIAKDNEEYSNQVFEILCSYIREETGKLDDWNKLTNI
jgi:hypothetical protein